MATILENVLQISEQKYNSEKRTKNYTLSPPYRNFSNSELYYLSKINEKKALCGTKIREYINAETLESCSLPIYCDNRSCTTCNKHKLYKFKKAHSSQISALSGSMKNPRAWVFTGWVLPLNEITRELCQKKLLLLFRLLKQFSSSEFSVHMEIKIRNDGLAYLHFHVVSAYVKKIRLVSKLWGRKIRNELALKPKSLSFYVSKYASKVPLYPTKSHEDLYTLLVYKLQMNRFSPKSQLGAASKTFDELYSVSNEFTVSHVREMRLKAHRRQKKKSNLDKPPPKFYIVELLEKEIENTLLKTGWIDNTGRLHMPDYHPFLYRKKTQNLLTNSEQEQSGAG